MTVTRDPLLQRWRPEGQRVALLVGALGAAFASPWAWSAPAASVDFVSGEGNVSGANGASRPLRRGVEVNQGDTITTGEGARAQLRFSDGAYVSLSPGSQFRVDEYRFNGRADGSEKGFFSLLKGGLRTITGLVGRVNKGAYQVSTSVATIGIRGTEYTIQYGNSITGSVGGGGITACNAGGCTNVDSGETFYVPSADVKAVITFKTVDLPPPPAPRTTAPGDVVVAADNRREDGANDFIPSLPPLAGGPIDLPTSGEYFYSGTTGSVTFRNSNNAVVVGGSVIGAEVYVDFADRQVTDIYLDLFEPNSSPDGFTGRVLRLDRGPVALESDGGFTGTFQNYTYLGSVGPSCSSSCAVNIVGALTGRNAEGAAFTFSGTVAGGNSLSGSVTLPNRSEDD
jgi:hypothetical protein